MQRLSKFFRPHNSVSLLYDYKNPDLQDLEALITEVSKYYQWTNVSHFLESKQMGKAMLLIKAARKGWHLKVRPFLEEREIASTVFIQTNFVGTNRLLPQEESEFKANGSEVAWEKVDPLRMSATWGNIVESKGNLIDFGIHQVNPNELTLDKQFIECQLQQTVNVAFLNFPPDPASEFKAVFVPKQGQIDKHTSLFNLPVWNYEG